MSMFFRCWMDLDANLSLHAKSLWSWTVPFSSLDLTSFISERLTLNSQSSAVLSIYKPRVTCFKHSQRTLARGASLPMAQLWGPFIIHPWKCQLVSCWFSSYYSPPVLGLSVTPLGRSCPSPRHWCPQWFGGLFQALHSLPPDFIFPKPRWVYWTVTRNTGTVGVQSWNEWHPIPTFYW